MGAMPDFGAAARLAFTLVGVGLVLGALLVTVIRLAFEGEIGFVEAAAGVLLSVGWVLSLIRTWGKSVFWLNFLILPVAVAAFWLVRQRFRVRAATVALEEDFDRWKHTAQVDPSNAGAHAYLGDAYIKVGRVDDAIAEYQEAVRLLPSDTRTRHKLDKALQQKRTAVTGLAPCPFCKEDIPAQAAVCPRCGAVLSDFGSILAAVDPCVRHRAFPWVMLALGTLGVAGLLTGRTTPFSFVLLLLVALTGISLRLVLSRQEGR